MIKEKFVSIFPYNVKSYLRNSIFDSRKNKGIEPPIFATLKRYLRKKKVNINTYDIPVKETIYKYVYFDLPYPWNITSFPIWKMIFLNRKKNILICNESAMVIPFNYMKVFNLFFTKVFTWNDDLVDNKKYFKIRLPKSSLGMKTVPRQFKDKKFDSEKLEKEIAKLMQDEDVTKKSGIYEYVLTRNEKFLNIRAFTDKMKREAYERQKGVCPHCKSEKKNWEIEEMEADHIAPWHEGGKTIAENCQMLCKDDNRRKSGK